MTPTEPADTPTPEGVGPPESIAVESHDMSAVLNDDGTVKEP